MAKAKTVVKKKKSTSRVKSTVPETSVAVIDVEGKKKGTLTLPPELFAVKVNKALLAQAVRVYLSNQREGSASTKTRGKVEGSTRKIYKQKGTGRARHGSIRAPIFVGGGIVFGPHPRDYSLEFPKKMRRQALASALTSQYQSGNIVVVDGLHDLAVKTKVMAKALSLVSGPVVKAAARRILFVVPNDAGNIVRSARNIASVDCTRADQLYAYDVLVHRVVFMKEAIGLLKKTFIREEHA